MGLIRLRWGRPLPQAVAAGRRMALGLLAVLAAAVLDTTSRVVLAPAVRATLVVIRCRSAA